MRSISAAGLQALFAQTSSDAILPLLTITSSEYPGTSRIVANMTSVIHESVGYQPLPFELVLAPDSADSVPVAKIRLDNVNQDLVALLRTATQPATVVVRIVRFPATGASVTEMGPLTFSAKAVQITASIIEITLAYETDFLNEPAVKTRFDNTIAPALYS